MLEFNDILYGKIHLPEWILPFLRTPEFVRLRGVRLSNVDSFQFKDFNGPTRWDHGIAVTALAVRCAQKRGLSPRESVHLSLAALFHDVATPPFAHTMEYVIEGFDHELESHRILRALAAGDSSPTTPIFASQLPQFQHVCRKVSRQLGFNIDPDEVARLLVGDGDLGFLINGTLDLDNADNVTRASLYLGFAVDKDVPVTIAEWLAVQQQVPLNLNEVAEGAVVKWVEYRKRLYEAFYTSSDDELGRQAFLQHLCRRAFRAGIPRLSLIWNTDESLLTLFEKDEFHNQEHENSLSMRELVQRYRLLEQTFKIIDTDIEDEETLRILKSPNAADWIEKALTTPSFEPFVLINSRRYEAARGEALFPPAPGSLQVFKLGQITKPNQLPEWLRSIAPDNGTAHSMRRFLSQALKKQLPIWAREKPWLKSDSKRKTSVVANLNAVGDWSFRLSRNETFHSYPSTFVHAIPATLINCLGLRGELILDPFGGTGQTAVEAVRAGGRAISADINSIAVLVAKSKLTYLSPNQRKELKSIQLENILKCEPCIAPQFDLLEKWHHPKTLKELCHLRTFIEMPDDDTSSQFLKAAFSAILTMATGRRGKQHGFFADNTPLSKSEAHPPYQNAIELFLQKLKKNLELTERLYSFLERSGRDPQKELDRAKVIKLDVRNARPKDYHVEPNSVAGIVTSPPYLCMSDYSLGQRLSYYWLFPDDLAEDHKQEIGARRKRSQPEVALEAYLADFDSLAKTATRLLRGGGFIATVLGAPVAEAFKSADILHEIDTIMAKNGFSQLWTTWRRIHWHRNHGYQRLKKERIAVYVLDDQFRVVGVHEKKQATQTRASRLNASSTTQQLSKNAKI